MKRLIAYLKEDLKEAILAPLFKMLEAIFELIVPLIVARMIDVGIASRSTSSILKDGGLLILLGVIGLAAAVTAQYFSAKAAVDTGTRIRGDLFRHMQTLSWRQIDETGTSTLITRLTSDINTVQNGVNMFLRLFLRSPFVVFGAVVMAFTVDVHTSIVFVIVLPVLILIVALILKITMPLYQKVQKQLDTVLLKTRENLLGVRVVRAFNRQESEKEEFSGHVASLYRKQIFAGKITALLNPLTYAVINLGIIGVLWYGGAQVNSGLLTQGAVIALVNYMSLILTELVKLANLIILLSRAMASMKRVDTIFEMQNDIPEGTESFPSSPDGVSVSFDHLTFRYTEGADAALSDISFHVPAGTTVGIIGGTGSGKSTLVNLLPGFYLPDSGSITVNGQDIRTIRKKELREAIGMVPQKAVLFQGTIRQNMQWGKRDASDEEIRRALTAAQALDFVEQKTEGLDYKLEQEGRNLSGGQRQRLTIARALVRDPQILILDDSASALDFATDAALRRSIRSMPGLHTVFLVSQRVSTVRSADRILVLDDGKAAGYGTHSDLILHCPAYREICESQLSRDEFEKETAKGGNN
ncbi:MAG: ABC transporter ATP-binding protein [Eubacteriales bacterium]|nr:ABC transporter ATP-binding protein [Eubacteriales bacterium]